MRRSYDISVEGLKRAGDQADGDLVVSMAFSSEVPAERWWGIEVLDHGDSSIRLDRLRDGAPVLYNHNRDDQRGTHQSDSIAVGKDRVLRGNVRIAPVDDITRSTIARIEKGILKKASIGYRVHKVVEQTTKKSADGKLEKVERVIPGDLYERLIEEHETRSGRPDRRAFYRSLDVAVGSLERGDDEEPIYRVMDWEPLENSLVTIPLDNGVGIGRAMGTEEIEGRAFRSSPPAEPAINKRGTSMTTKTEAELAAEAEAAANRKISASEAEKQRKEFVTNLCKLNRIDSRVEARWIEDGTSLHEIGKELLAMMEERSRAKPLDATRIGLTARETQSYSLFRALRAMRYGAQDRQYIEEAAFEIECSKALGKRLNRSGSNLLVPAEVLTRPLPKEAMERAMATTPGSKGGYMISVTNMGFIDILRNRSVAMAMGARQLSGLEGNITFPRQTGKPTVTWQGGDGTSVTAADQTLGQLSMTPKTCIAITDVSEQLLRQASPSAEAFVMADLAADVAIDGVDNAVINGAGGAQPLGIKNTTGITSGQDAASATYAKILAFVSTAGGANAIRGNPGWVTNTAGAARLMQVQRFTSTDTPLWTGNMLDGQCVGFNAMSSEQLASGNLIFGSWDEIIIGDWGVLELSTDNGGTRFNQAQVGVRALWLVDVLLRYPQAFVVSTNLS